MSRWLVRGLVFAASMVAVRLIQGVLINQFETKALLISIVLLVLFASRCSSGACWTVVRTPGRTPIRTVAAISR